MGAGGLRRGRDAAFSFLEDIPASLYQGTLQPGEEPVRGCALLGPNPRQAGEAVQPPGGEPAWDGNPGVPREADAAVPATGLWRGSCCVYFSPHLADRLHQRELHGWLQAEERLHRDSGYGLSHQGVLLLLMHAWASPPCPASATDHGGGHPVSGFSWERASGSILLQPPPTKQVLG